MTKKTLSKAIPSTWMHGLALPEPWAGPGGLAPGKAEGEKGSEGGQGSSGAKGGYEGCPAEKKQRKRCLR